MSESAPQRHVRARIAALHRAGERPSAEYDQLRAMLDEVAKSQRNLRWQDADILLDVHFRRNGRRVIRRLGRLRGAYARRGEIDRYDRLWARVQDLLGELTVTTHGYGPRLGTRAADEVWAQVGRVLDELHATGRPAFVNSGTLLGLVRGDGVIAYDDDVDLALLLHATAPDAAAQEWIELRRHLREAGLLDVDFDGRGLVHTKAASPDGLKVDVFPGWLSGGRLFLWPYSFGEVAADEVIPLEPLVVDDATALAGPAQPEALLAANYGDDWRTPDPLFAFDWANAKKRFADFRQLVIDGYARQ